MKHEKVAWLIGFSGEHKQVLGDYLEEEGFRIKSQPLAEDIVHVDGIKGAALLVLDASSHARNGVPGLMRQLHADLPHSILLCVCSPENRSVISETLRYDNAEFVLKPISQDDIRQQLARHARRQHVRDQLEDSMRFIRRVVDTTPELIYLFDVVDDCNVYVNCRVCELLGCTPEGIPTVGPVFFASVMHPTDLPEARLRLQSHLLGAEDRAFTTSEYRIKDATGEWRWLRTRETVFSRTPSGSVKQILGSAQDVTERRQLEETRAHLASIVEHTSDAVIGKDLEGTIVSWNKAAEQMYGYDSANAIGRNISILIPVGATSEIPELLERIKRGEQIEHYETIRQGSDGQPIHVSVNISPICDSLGHITGASTIARRIDH